MMKTVLLATSVSALLLAAAPAFADCAADMKTTQDMAMKVTDAAKKDAAMKEMAMATDAMTKKDDAACKMHTDAAMKAMQ
jgi:hypothetical protein